MNHLSKKRILITGGLGYIGSEIFKVAKDYSKECLAIDKLASNNVLNLDLKDAAKTQKIIIDFKPDVIIHCATHSALVYRDHLLNSFQEDFSATINILNALANMPDCRLIYFSSSYVYSGVPTNQNYDEYTSLVPKDNFGIARKSRASGSATHLGNGFRSGVKRLYQISLVFGKNNVLHGKLNH